MAGISVVGVLRWADQMCVLGVGWRHLGVESQTWWDFACGSYGVTGSDKGLAGKKLVWWGWRQAGGDECFPAMPGLGSGGSHGQLCGRVGIRVSHLFSIF